MQTQFFRHLIAPIFLFPLLLQSQSIERQVIGAFGSQTQTSAGLLDCTVGEAFIQNTITDQIHLSAGFHQTSVFTSVQTYSPKDFSLMVYPNPVTDLLYVKIESPAMLSLFHVDGRIAIKATLVVDDVSLQMNALPAGLYVLRTSSLDGKYFSANKIQHL